METYTLYVAVHDALVMHICETVCYTHNLVKIQ